MSPSVETEIDRLYQLPPGRFTAARNALAREVGGKDGAGIRSLPRPTLPAWAVNSLYWRKKPAHERIVRAAEALRRAQEALLTGKSADLRAVTAAHRSAVSDGLKEIDLLAAHAGRPLTAATRQAVRQILEALPGGVEPGRLARSIEAPGFEVFAGVDPRSLRPAPAKKPGPRAAATPQKAEPRPGPPRRKEAEKSDTDRKARKADARKALLEARKNARSARTALGKVRSSLAKAEARLEEEGRRERRARESHEEARRRLENAEKDAEQLRREAGSAEAVLRTAEEAEERARTALTDGGEGRPPPRRPRHSAASPSSAPDRRRAPARDSR